MPTFFINSDSFKASNAFVATLGAAPGSTYLGQILAAGLPAAANAMLGAMSATTAAARGDAIAANLGLTGTAATTASNYLATVSFAGAASTHGAGLLAALDLFTTLQNDATFGAAATAYVSRVNSALAYSSVAANNSTDLTTLAAAVGSSGSTGAAATFTLTTGVDTYGGTSGNDTITGFSGTNATVSGADSVNGGAGTDTLRIFSDSATTALPGTITSIESLFINDTVQESRNIATGTLSSVVNLTLQGGTSIDGGTVTATIGDGDTLTLDGITDGDGGAQTTADGGVAIAQAATLTAATVTLKDLGAATANTSLVVDFTGTGVATVNATLEGTNHVTLLNAGTSQATLNLSGSGALTTYADLAASITTINGSTATGILSLDLAGTSVRTVTGGSGNDIFRLGADYVGGTTGATRDTIDGGSGTDTLSITTAIAAAIAANQSNLTSIETISISDASGAVDMRYFTTATRLDLAAGKTAADSTITINSGTTVNAKADLGDGSHTFRILGTGTTDSMTLILDSGVDFLLATGDDTFTGIETINIQTQSTVAGTVNIFADTFVMTATASTETVNISGKTAITFTGVVTADVINGSGLVGTSAILTLTGGTASAAVITGGEAADALRGSSAADIISGGGGADVFTSTAGADSMTGGAGADIFYFADAAHTGNFITDFTAGTGGDVIRIDDSGFGDLTGADTLAFKAISAGITAAATTDNVLAVQTAIAGTSAAAVEDAYLLAGGGATNFSGTDIMIVIYNSTTGKGELWSDLDGDTDNNGTGVTLVATLDNITTLAGVQALVAANFNVVA